MSEHDLELVVAAVEAPADDVRAVVLRDAGGAALPPWTAGAHIDLHVGDLVRQYSLCGDVDDLHAWRVAVLREPEGRGGSGWVHDVLAVGDTVRARGPRNHFALADAEAYVFVAGGIGITPLLPMIAAADAAGADWRLEYGGRSRASMAYGAELVARYGDRVRLHPADEVGMLDLEAILGTPRTDALVYCCGPEPLLRAVEQRCASWPVGSLHVERFAPKEREVDPDGETSFVVELVESALEVTVPPDRTILDAVRDAGVDVLSSCEEGTCGTCETGVLGGRVDHRDSLLTAAEQAAHDVMLLCVSRAERGCDRLVLER
ncbi:ferredoxin-NADP reductase [Mumia flava]|uniref:Ferredoxin-NADP reductase n=1 Tax=Mumia flava TaxID=1348852 RepID=A0A0B2BC43_9ACTN|nr:PDR/VanB family oxidoreductase [Mumia flava]PJJ57534.1 ferredoxin-NADP reductase [Mumia flava]